MKKTFLELLVLAVLVGTLGIMVALPNKSVYQGEQEAKQRVVKIMSYDDNGESQGTGTLVGNNYILTNAHLFPKNFKNLGILFRRINDEKFQPATLIFSDILRDLALLKFKGEDNTKLLKITSHWYMGEQLVILGNPPSADFILGHTKLVGTTLSRRPGGPIRAVFVFPCDTGGPGFSGGGIYNTEGQFMGIFEMYSPIFNVCFAIPSSEILERGLNQPWKLK